MNRLILSNRLISVMGLNHSATSALRVRLCHEQQQRIARGSLRGYAVEAGNKSKFVFDCTEDNFDELVIESKVPVILDVHAEWCPPCKMLGPVLEKEVDALKGKVTLVKIDSDENPSLARSLRVSSLPTVFGVHEGQQVDMFIGYPGPEKVKEFVAKIAKLNGGKK